MLNVYFYTFKFKCYIAVLYEVYFKLVMVGSIDERKLNIIPPTKIIMVILACNSHKLYLSVVHMLIISSLLDV